MFQKDVRGDRSTPISTNFRTQEGTSWPSPGPDKDSNQPCNPLPLHRCRNAGPRWSGPPSHRHHRRDRRVAAGMDVARLNFSHGDHADRLSPDAPPSRQHRRGSGEHHGVVAALHSVAGVGGQKLVFVDGAGPTQPLMRISRSPMPGPVRVAVMVSGRRFERRTVAGRLMLLQTNR